MRALVVEVPALHLAYVGCYGSQWVTTPALDRLAAEGVVFDQHYADTLGASRTPWTGRYEFPGPSAVAGAAGMGPSDLPAVLAAHRIPFLHVGPPAPGSDAIEGASPLEQTLETVAEALDRLGSSDPWLLWADLPSLHPPWELPERFLQRYFAVEEAVADADEELPTPLPDPPTGAVDPMDFALWERIQLTYAGAVSYLDAGLELLVADLRERSLLEDLLLLVTAERGLALGEHGVVGDGRPWLHDELIHLPLIVRLPGGAEAGQRVAALTQPVDLFPTLLDAFGLPLPEQHGHSLFPVLRGAAAQVRPYACAGSRAGEAVEWALRTPNWAFLLPITASPDERPRGPQLYVKPEDRWEVNDVRQHHLERAEHLEQVLRGFVTAAAGPAPLAAPELHDFEAGPAGQEVAATKVEGD